MEAHRVLGSTNERALEWAAAGAPEGSTVVAEHQTAGRGRHGRRWTSQAGQNLTFSVVLHPAEAPAAPSSMPLSHLGLLALAGGLAVCETVSAVMPASAPQLKPQIKWPNDVLIEDRKCCGILLESSFAGTRSGPVVLGVGLNVNQCAFSEVSSAGLPPTSLARAAGHPVERAPLLARLLQHLEARYSSLFVDGGDAVRQACEEHLTSLGEPVTLHPAGLDDPEAPPLLEGTLLGLADDGALRLQTTDGERTVYAGDVTTQ